MICSLIFSQFYTLQEYGQDEKEGVPPDVRIACQVDETYQHVNGESWFDPSAIDSWLTEQEDGSIVCAAGDASAIQRCFVWMTLMDTISSQSILSNPSN